MKFRRPYIEEDHKAVEHNGGDTDDGVEDEDHGDHEEGGLVEPGPGARHNLQHRARYRHELFYNSKAISRFSLIFYKNCGQNALATFSKLKFKTK